MNNTFTPGPWKVKKSESKPAFNVVGTSVGLRYKIARCPYNIVGNSAIDEMEETEAKANAALIAAAPDMYEALKYAKAALKELAGEGYEHSSIKPMIDAALAKAEGKEVVS